MGGGLSDGDAIHVDVSGPPIHLIAPILQETQHRPDPLTSCLAQYDPASLQYMLEFFRNVANSFPADGSSATASSSHDSGGGDSIGGGSGGGSGGVVPLDPAAAREPDATKRAGIIVLREDLDFYVIPHKREIGAAEMTAVKRAAAKSLLRQDGIFSGLKKSDEPGTTEAHLIEMLTAGFVFSSFLSPSPFVVDWAGTNHCGIIAEASTTTIGGVTARASRARRSCAAWPWRGCGPTSGATRWATAPWAWRRSCCCSGASRRGGAGGRVLS